jgi:hypothetical protein
MLFRRKAKSLGKPKEWKNIEILGKKFDEALDEAIRNYDSEKESLSAEEQIEEFRKGILGDPDEEKPQETKKKTDYVIDSQILRLWNRESEEERYDKMKETERQVNAELEAARIPTCPKCRCNPCICRDY